MTLKHNDCSNFSSIDVAKGICRVTGNIVEIDSKTCSSYSKLAKCKFCANFANPDKDNIGTCIGLDKDDWVYGELNARTCNAYKEN